MASPSKARIYANHRHQDAQGKNPGAKAKAKACNDSIDSSPIISLTSTIEYDQESFSTFQNKATKLTLSLFPGYHTEDVQVTRMEGGSYNRIIGIELENRSPKQPWYSLARFRKRLQPCITGRKPKHTPNRPKHFILRIPRSPTPTLPYQVTTLSYLAQRIAHPVPKIVVYDASADNPLGQAYMLQERLPGHTLSEIWDTLNQAQKKSIVRQISHILLDLQKVKNQCHGILSLRNNTFDLKRDLVRVEPIPIPQSQPPSCAEVSTVQTTKHVMLDLCVRQREHAKAMDLPPLNKIWTRIMGMINILHALGFIPDTSPFYLSHEDFYARNVLASVIDDGEVELTAILDWDYALFAPKFMSTRAPFWLWGGGRVDGEDERGALVEPEDEGLLELKRYFEGIVGEAFCKEAYMRESVLARGLWNVLLRGLNCGGDVLLVEEILDEFKGLHPNNV